MRQQGRNVLDFVEDHRPPREAAKEADGVDCGEVPLQRIVEADIVDLLPRLVSQERGLAGLPRSCDQDGGEPGKGLTQGCGELALTVHLTILKTDFSFVKQLVNNW